MREASADLLSFVDDDNVLTRDYLSDAVTVKGEWPFSGVLGSGAIIPEFETEPRKDVTELFPLFGSPCVLITTVEQCFCLHRRDALECVSERRSPMHIVIRSTGSR